MGGDHVTRAVTLVVSMVLRVLGATTHSLLDPVCYRTLLTHTSLSSQPKFLLSSESSGNFE